MEAERRANGDVDLRLNHSNEQFRLLVQSVIDYAIFMLDAEGYVANWNSGAQRIKGYTADEVIGRHFSMFYTDEDRQAGLPARGLRIAAESGRFEKEGWRVRKDGSRFWANVVLDAIRDDTGTLLGFAKVTRDITERREAQLKLDAAREALFHSQKMEAVGQLTGGIAHDFNNLLAVVQGGLELLRKRLPDEPQTRQLLDNVLLGVQRGSALTQRMLAFARRQELRVEAVDLAGLVKGMASLLERAMGPALYLETRFPAALSRVDADAAQLESAIVNLAINARDAMPTGGILVVSARDETVGPAHKTGLKPGSYVCLAVIDTGEGMDAETLERAIEPYFTTKGVGKGTGLGLSMVHGMAEQTGGRLMLHSEQGRGTTAEIWLPASAGGEVPAKAPTQEAAAPLAPLTVLLVDDDALVLGSLVAMLEDLGHRVMPALSAPRALEMLRTGPFPDIVITDQAMPQMTGRQLAEQIQTRWPRLPILVVSGFTEMNELKQALPPGVARLAKPFKQRDLVAAMAKILKARRRV